MTVIKVNADYESVLFTGNPGSPKLNESIEFLAFFLTNETLFTSKKYSQAYLDYVEAVTGNRPKTTNHGPARNWWGQLKDIDRERTLNSKLTSTNLIHHLKWCQQTSIVLGPEEVPPLLHAGQVLLKDPFGMSGQRIQVLNPGAPLPQLKYPVICEPFFDRRYDFSHYVFQDGKTICYENSVDERFQYRGTLFRNYHSCKLSDLSFYSQVALDKWHDFESKLTTIKEHYLVPDFEPGFSIDSFVYFQDTQLCIRPLSEVNYRRTMGLVAYELAKKFGLARPWMKLLLGRPLGSFTETQLKLEPYRLYPDSARGVLLLSPGDTRFEILLLSAESEESGHQLLQEVRQLLPAAEFAV